MQQAKTKKSISVPEMGRMLGLGKVESYWLVKKNYTIAHSMFLTLSPQKMVHV